MSNNNKLPVVVNAYAICNTDDETGTVAQKENNELVVKNNTEITKEIKKEEKFDINNLSQDGFFNPNEKNLKFLDDFYQYLNGTGYFSNTIMFEKKFYKEILNISKSLTHIMFTMRTARTILRNNKTYIVNTLILEAISNQQLIIYPCNVLNGHYTQLRKLGILTINNNQVSTKNCIIFIRTMLSKICMRI